jgi:hypothetical protein
MRFKVTILVQATPRPGEHPAEARRRIWLAMDTALTNCCIGEQSCEDVIPLLPEQLAEGDAPEWWS